MARDPDDLVIRILRDIQATLAEHTRMHLEHKSDFRQARQQIVDLNETVISSGGLAVKAAVKTDNLQGQINSLDDRVKRLEDAASHKP